MIELWKMSCILTNFPNMWNGHSRAKIETHLLSPQVCIGRQPQSAAGGSYWIQAFCYESPRATFKHVYSSKALYYSLDLVTYPIDFFKSLSWIDFSFVLNRYAEFLWLDGPGLFNQVSIVLTPSVISPICYLKFWFNENFVFMPFCICVSVGCVARVEC